MLAAKMVLSVDGGCWGARMMRVSPQVLNLMIHRVMDTILRMDRLERV